jgi:hypothetical protein
VLEIASREYFDRRESVLASYDLEQVSESGATGEEVLRVVQSLVESDGWRDNGGDLAVAYLLGSRLFVEAPPRFHDKIRWILSELASRAPVNPPGDQGERGAVDHGFRQYPLGHADAGAIRDKLRAIVGGAEGVRVEFDAQTNSLIVAGDPEAIEAGLVSSLDVAQQARADGEEPVIVVIEYDGKREVLAVDSARVMSRADLLGKPRAEGRPLMLEYFLNLEQTRSGFEASVTPAWLRDLPLVVPETR